MFMPGRTFFTTNLGHTPTSLAENSMKAKPLTHLLVTRLKAKPARYELADTLQRGLRLIVQPSGAKSWACRTTVHGRPVKVTLGRLALNPDAKASAHPELGGDLTLADARFLAADVLRQARQGIDVTRQKRIRADARLRAAQDTFGAVALSYMQQEAGLVISADGQYSFAPSSLRTARIRLATLQQQVLPTLSTIPITDLRKSDVVRLLDRLAAGTLTDPNGKPIAGGRVSADRCLALVRKILNWYKTRSDDFRPPDLSELTRKKPSEQVRSRILTDVEIKALWAVTAKMPGPFPQLVRYLLLTGARRSEAAEMPWSEYDENTGEWSLPPARDKSKRGLVRPLAGAARAILAARPRLGPYVFTTTGKLPIRGLSKLKANLDTLMLVEMRRTNPTALLDPWVVHDIRRSSRSLLARAGVITEVAEAMLGHTQRGVIGTYQRYDYAAEKKTGYEKLARLIDLIVNHQGAKVVQFTKEG
jgi:integrase